MAVSFVGAGTAVLGIDALSVPWPGSQSAGDIGLLLLETNETDTVSVSGVNELASSPQYHVSQLHKLSVFWVEATGSDANISIPDPGNHGIAQILVFSGVDTTAPINVTVGTSPDVSSTSVTCTGVTTTADGCGIVHIVGTGRDGNTTAQFDSWANANLASITEIADVTTGTAGGGGFGAAWGIKTTAGSTGDCTVTMAVSAIYTTITVALEPDTGGSGSQTLTPSLFTNSQTFHNPTISVGSVSLNPTLVTNSQTFYSPTITQDGGAQYLSPSVLNNSQTFYSATVTRGSVDILPALFTNTQSWYSPTVSLGGVIQNIAPPLHNNTQTFYSATVFPGSVNLTPSLVTNDQVFYNPSIGIVGETTLTPEDIAAIADAVWAHSTAIDFSDKMLICSRILRNKTVTDPVTGIMTVYADDGTTPYLTAQLYEDINESQTYRGQGAEVRERLQ